MSPRTRPSALVSPSTDPLLPVHHSTNPSSPLAFTSISSTSSFPSATHHEKHGYNPSSRILRFKSCLPRLRSRRSRIGIALAVIALLWVVCNTVKIGTWRRDFGYVLRPVWDTKPKAFTVIPQFAAPLRGHSTLGRRDVHRVGTNTSLIGYTGGYGEGGADETYGQAGGKRGEESGELNGRAGVHKEDQVDIPKWCDLHGWTPRDKKPLLVDAVLLSSEIDMLEIRIREYLDHVDIFVVVESDRTFSGAPKRLFFAEKRQYFEDLVASARAKGSIYPKILYGNIDTLLPAQPKGSFENEYKMRQSVSALLDTLDLHPGDLVLNSDVDEIIAENTLHLLKACSTPTELHLNVRNYRYGWRWPIPDGGYWRPHLTTVGPGRTVAYGHGRVSDLLLQGAGWHCTFCFKTLGEMKEKMQGYSHNDRVRDTRIAGMERIRRKVCEGREIFEMWPVSFFASGRYWAVSVSRFGQGEWARKDDARGGEGKHQPEIPGLFAVTRY